jgi:hypothetical protein
MPEPTNDGKSNALPNSEGQPFLPYDPGLLPTLPSPLPGQSIAFEVPGLPPVKDESKSIRNINHPLHSRFVLLRRTATAAMAGRAWFFGPIELRLTIFGTLEPRRKTPHYLGGIFDSLGGSSGFTFTYLPIVFEDDSQICSATTLLKDAQSALCVRKIYPGGFAEMQC